MATYRYDALNRRIRETRGSTTTDLYYSSAWQVLEERIGTAAQVSYVWSPVYVDAMIARDRDTDANGSLDERLYVIQDANFNVTGLMNTSGTVQERYVYDPFGGFTILTGTWGSRSSSSYAWKYQHQGLKWDSDLGGYDERNRILGPTIGRFFQMDPIGFGGGDVDLYRGLDNTPVVGLDPLGLQYQPGQLGFPPSPLNPSAPPGGRPGNGHPGMSPSAGWPPAMPGMPSSPPGVVNPPGGRLPRYDWAADLENWGNNRLWPSIAGLFPNDITGPINPGSNGGAVSGTVIGGTASAAAGYCRFGPFGLLMAIPGGIKGGVNGSAAGSAHGDSFWGGAGAGVGPGAEAGFWVWAICTVTRPRPGARPAPATKPGPPNPNAFVVPAQLANYYRMRKIYVDLLKESKPGSPEWNIFLQQLKKMDELIRNFPR